MALKFLHQNHKDSFIVDPPCEDGNLVVGDSVIDLTSNVDDFRVVI